MDDTTKLSPKLLSALLKLLKGQNADPALQPDALLETLTPEQFLALYRALQSET